jgi:hypothetical protein
MILIVDEIIDGEQNKQSIFTAQKIHKIKASV